MKSISIPLAGILILGSLAACSTPETLEPPMVAEETGGGTEIDIELDTGHRKPTTKQPRPAMPPPNRTTTSPKRK